MPPRPTITIPQPCHEGWTQMTPAAQGRHCAACDKVVVDFKRMTDTEVVRWLQHRPSGSTCGRFATQQLNRPLLVPPPPALRWQQWVAATVAIVGLRTGAAPEAQAQRPIPTQQHVITMGMVAVPRQIELFPANLPPTVVRGIVLDSASRQPLPGVSVLVAGTTRGASTDTEGKFELNLPAEFREAELIQLEFSSIGYVTERRFFNPRRAERISIGLAPDVKGRFISTDADRTTSRYTLWQRVTRPFRRQ
jgi:hypothetical protein